jgi:cytochrome P450 family 6
MELPKSMFYVLLPVVLLVFFFLKHKYNYWQQRGVAHIKPNWLFGNMYGVGFKMNLVEKFQEVYDKFRGQSALAGIYFMTSPCVILIDPELIKTILVRDFHRFHDRGVFFNEIDDPLSANLFSIEGETWKFLRNKLSPTFTSGRDCL